MLADHERRNQSMSNVPAATGKFIVADICYGEASAEKQVQLHAKLRIAISANGIRAAG